MITNTHPGTRVDEVARGIYRINTPLDLIPGGFSVNSYLVVDDEPVLFHAGWRKMFPLTREAVATVIPVEKRRWVGGSHFEGDEFGATNEFLATAPGATVWKRDRSPDLSERLRGPAGMRAGRGLGIVHPRAAPAMAVRTTHPARMGLRCDV